MKSNIIILFMLVLLSLLPAVYGRCGFSVVCSGNDCDPVDVDTEPWIGRVDMCPEYDGKEICCNANQNKQLQANFQAIDATFGNDGGGCDV